MVAFNAVAEQAVGEAPAAQVQISLTCEPGVFTLTGNPAGFGQEINSLEPTATGAVGEFAVGEAPASAGLGLAAQTGSFVLAGQPAVFGRTERAEAGSYALSGQPAQLAGAAGTGAYALGGQALGVGLALAAEPGSYALTLQAAQQAWTAAAGTYALGGQLLGFGVSLRAAAGSYALAGATLPTNIDLGATLLSAQGAVGEYAVGEFPAEIRFGIRAEAGSYAVTGQPVALRVAERAETGAYSLAGGPAQIGWRHEAGAYVLTGQPVALSTAIAAEAGAYTLAGGPADIGWRHEAGAYVLTGQAMTLNVALQAQPGSYVLTLETPFVGIRAQAGVFVLSGLDVAFAGRMAAQAGAYTLTGQDAALLNIFRMFPQAGVYTLTGQDAGRAHGLAAEPGAYALSGFAAFRVAVALGAGQFTLSGGASGFDVALKLATGQYTLLGWNVVDALGPSGDHIFLVEIKAHDGVAERTFYLGTDDYTSAPSDTPRNQYYASRISDPGNLERHLFSQGETRGRATVGAGDIKINSGDPGHGELIDDWLGYGWSGREIRIKALPRGARSLAAASTLFVGRLDRLTATRPLEEFSLQIADRLADLDKPLLTTLFVGTTLSTAATAEGNADLKGQIKQRCYGSTKEVPLQPANPYDLIYLVSVAGDIQSITVYDGGVALAYDGSSASLAALRSATIAPGHYRRFAGYVRLGGTPTFTLTADVVEGAGAADRTAAQIARRMLVDFGIPPNEIITGAFDALDDINAAPCGILVNDDRTALAACQQVLDSIGAWLAPGRDGSLAVGRHEAPQGSTTGLVFDCTGQSIGDSLERVDGEIPVYRVTLQYARVNTVQAASVLAGSVSAERRAYLASEWRSVVAEDLSVKLKHLDAREIIITTFLTEEADAQAEADRQLALLKVERERYDITLPLSDAWAGDLGLSMTLVHPRLGFAGGKPFSIIGRVDDYQRETVRFNLWG